MQMHPKPALRFPVLRAGSLLAALLLTACGTSEGLDWDMRSEGIDTSGAAIAASDAPPQPDARGVISYPNYQVAVARRGDTVSSLAARISLPAAELASFNALQPEDGLRSGEVLALPTRVASASQPGTSGAAASGRVDVASIATTALDRVATASPAATAAPTGEEPVRYQVKRGETAFSIARSFGVSAKALAGWNGLDAELSIREGQFLIIPTAGSPPPFQVSTDEVAPGSGSPTPEPPSAREPLPDEATAPPTPKAATPKAATATAVASPDLGAERTAASATKFAMPVVGSIIRAYQKGKNDGIDIAAAAGAPVLAAEDGTVAAITTDTSGTPIVVIKHADNLLTDYAGVDGLKVAKGAVVKRGQTIAVVKAGDPAFLHFEVRRGVESLDPMTYLQ